MIRFLVIGVTTVLMLLATPAAAQNPVGDWQGTLQIGPQQSFRIVVHIEEGDDGALRGTLSSPDQNVTGLTLRDIDMSEEKLSFTVPGVSGSYIGTWNAANEQWVGTWTQGASSLPLVLSAGAVAAPPPPPSLPADWAVPSDDRIATLIQDRISGREGAGMVVGVIDPDGRRTIARGPTGGTPFGDDTVFEIGSISKVFTALLLADMALRGEVSLDDPVVKYLPEGAIMPRRGRREITLRSLALHLSGLPRLPDNMPYDSPGDPYADYTVQDLLDFLGGHELTREVGSQYEYSNLGVGLLGYALGRAAGTDYETLLGQRITGPLGMDDTAIVLSPAQEARFAQGHDMYMRPASPWHLPALQGAGAIRSTAEDMLTFLAAALDPNSPIGEAMELTRSHGIDSKQPALGWMLVDAPSGEVLMHGGGTGGYRAHVALQHKTGRAVVALTNAAIEPAAEDIALHVLVGAPVTPTREVPPAPVEREEVSLSSDQLDHVVGTYQLTPDVQMQVRRDGEQLVAQLTGQQALPIHPESPLEFFWKVVDAQVRFLEEDGVITGAVFTQSGQRVEAKKVG